VSPLDLSFRYKIPLWGTLLVVLTAVAVSAALMAQTYEEMEEDLTINTSTLADTLIPNVFSAMIRDNVWRVYELVSNPLHSRDGDSGEWGAAENILVVDNDQRIFAAAYPKFARLGTPLRELGPEFAVVAERLRLGTLDDHGLIETAGSTRLLFTTAIAEEGARLGTLIVVLSKGGFQTRFMAIARYGLLAGIGVLCVLLPFNWYWGHRMAEPLVQLADRMKDLGSALPKPLDPAFYRHGDEIGSLFKTYNRMLGELKEKEDLERQVVHADRLAALGQLAAGVAHEINNPLGGMLVAIDTLKSQNVSEPRTAKTIALLERGLDQIRETVGALLVEARVKSRNLSERDIEDVLVLVLPQVHKKSLHLDWHNELDSEIGVPATLVRQVLMNLMLNAIHAASMQGQVGCHVTVGDRQLQIVVTNDGPVLSTEQMSHLFEPFSPLSAEGHGLGLWVTYQIVHQLGGRIAASQDDHGMSFSVAIPLGGQSA